MMEMRLQAEHIPEQKDQLMLSGEKLLRWLNYLGQTDLAAKRSCKMLTDLMISAAPHIGHSYEPPPEFAEMQLEQQMQQEPQFLGPEYAHLAFGSRDPLAGGPSSPQGQQGLDPFLGMPTAPAASSTTGFTESPHHHQTLLGVPGINILARTGYDNLGLLSSFPFQTIADDAATSAAAAAAAAMQLGSPDTQMWNWQGFPVPASHESEQQQLQQQQQHHTHTPTQEFSSQMYPIGSGFTPAYSVYGETTEGYQTSDVEPEFTGTTQAPSHLQPGGDPHYHHPQHRPPQ
ncbi:hypothetical protein AA313_de0204141 [Arthrobotrys entomopaga]|nr:hypothetical protein AA313_de0204141 [Arthrobotrys entomopaga]